MEAKKIDLKKTADLVHFYIKVTCTFFLYGLGGRLQTKIEKQYRAPLNYSAQLHTRNLYPLHSMIN